MYCIFGRLRPVPEYSFQGTLIVTNCSKVTVYMWKWQCFFSPLSCPEDYCIHIIWEGGGGAGGKESFSRDDYQRAWAERQQTSQKNFCVTHHFFKGWNVPPRQRDSRHEIGPKKGVIRDIIWQHNQKLWNLRCFQLLSNKKPCTKVLEIQKLAGFDCFLLKMLPNPQFRSYKNGMHQKINPR